MFISKGSIADYTPLSLPMVPGIVIHCVNEVEARGLSEVGIYRVPGSEREVRELKDKFLRGKGIPNLVCFILFIYFFLLNYELIKLISETFVIHYFLCSLE